MGLRITPLYDNVYIDPEIRYTFVKGECLFCCIKYGTPSCYDHRQISIPTPFRFNSGSNFPALCR